MKKPAARSIKDITITFGPAVALLALAIFVAVKFVNPAPPRRLVMSTGDLEGDYHAFGLRYQAELKKDGIDLVLRPSRGAAENLDRLMDEDSDVEVALVQDGLGTAKEADDLESLGSLYYEPLWMFYRGKTEITHFSELKGKRIAIGAVGDGIHDLVKSLLRDTGVDEHDATFVSLGWDDSAHALERGDVDAAFYLATAEDPFIDALVNNRDLRLMSVDQSEAISRQFPYLHHLTVPHGLINLKDNLPAQDTHVLAPTVTLLVRDSIHPALTYLLLQAAAKIHGDAGLLERKGEFPIDKDFIFPLSEEAKHYYKSGTPFWQRYMPFWLATIVDRFLVVIIPLTVLVLPLLRTVPRIYDWRIRTKISKCYGELKFLELQVKNVTDQNPVGHQLKELDKVEDRVNAMKVPLKYAEHIYSLRGHIQFVRERLK